MIVLRKDGLKLGDHLSMYGMTSTCFKKVNFVFVIRLVIRLAVRADVVVVEIIIFSVTFRPLRPILILRRLI